MRFYSFFVRFWVNCLVFYVVALHFLGRFLVYSLTNKFSYGAKRNPDR